MVTSEAARIFQSPASAASGSTVSAVNMHLRSLLSASLDCVLFYVMLLCRAYRFIMLLLVALFGLAFVVCDIMVVVAYFLYLCDSA